ncbi:hypothetical protein GOODEAATRI_004812, partial [Goodea atripinnis]
GAYRYEADRTYCCVEEQGIDNNGTRFKRPTARCGVVVRVQIPRAAERIQSWRDLAGLDTLSDLHL